MNPYQSPRAPAPADTEGRDRFWALFLAIVSVFVCAPVTAPLAILEAVRLTRTGRHNGIAAASFVLAALGLVSSLLFWFLTIWQFLSPGERH